ncbi:hypothetical protein [Salinadaptatus halalkaliphilus]|uniref:hypothetical protein n=1 Tax=Salinadaptatus halalkaliphilus TaxID=2419781 RepID=UPI001141CDA1|nr:hypothetical protein [Salinadaptatus halalkaliphilus]
MSTLVEMGYGLSSRIRSSKGTTRVPATVVSQHGDEQPNEGSFSDDPDELLQNGTDAVRAAKDAQQRGAFDDAIDQLERAIAQCERVQDRSSSAELTRRAAELGTAAKTDLQAVRSSSPARAELTETLSVAESLLQTAIAAHVRGKGTVARTRYRQAMSNYDAALELLDDGEISLLEGDIKAAIDPGDVPPRDDLSTTLGLDAETAEALSAAEIATRTDSNVVDNVEKIIQEYDVDSETASKLTALAWLDPEHVRTFSDRTDIEKRYTQAEIGCEAAT